MMNKYERALRFFQFHGEVRRQARAENEIGSAAQEALGYRIPNPVSVGGFGGRIMDGVFCPRCGSILNDYDRSLFCQDCGQALSWTEEEEDAGE